MTAATTKARVERISPLTNSIIALVLKPDTWLDYQPGQYLQMQAGKEWLSYSIANAPLGSHTYELHIRHEPKNNGNQKLLTEIKERGEVCLRMPFGDCYLARLEAKTPIIFIAGGTGFAPVKAMIEQLLAVGDARFFELYWSARSQSDLYMDEKAKQWQAHVNQFRYVSLLPSSVPQETLASLIINQHYRTLADYQFVIGGPFEMVFAIRDALLDAGVSAQRLYSDAFSFEEKKE